MSTYVNLVVDQGADYEADVLITDENEDPIDLQDYVISGFIKKSYTSETLIPFEFDISEEDLGVMILKLPAVTSNAMNPGRYVYDIYGKNLNTNLIQIFIRGNLEVVPGITKFEEEEV